LCSKPFVTVYSEGKEHNVTGYLFFCVLETILTVLFLISRFGKNPGCSVCVCVGVCGLWCAGVVWVCVCVSVCGWVCVCVYELYVIHSPAAAQAEADASLFRDRSQPLSVNDCVCV